MHCIWAVTILVKLWGLKCYRDQHLVFIGIAKYLNRHNIVKRRNVSSKIDFENDEFESVL